MSPGQHPWIACIVIVAAGAIAFTLVLLLVVIPAAGQVTRAPAQLGQWYQHYWNNVCWTVHPDGKGCAP